ncbi:hypothetical protein FRC12_015381 [Ceratobasidium sp. 428]|nr:hypothetical protein FRC12_015381 [Ceratobasidium sp. 428]
MQREPDCRIRIIRRHTQNIQPPLDRPTQLLGTHADYARCLAYAFGTRWVASGSFDRTIKLWDISRASGPSFAASLDNQGAELTTLSMGDADPKASIYAVATDPARSVVAGPSGASSFGDGSYQFERRQETRIDRRISRCAPSCCRYSRSGKRDRHGSDLSSYTRTHFLLYLLLHHRCRHLYYNNCPNPLYIPRPTRRAKPVPSPPSRPRNVDSLLPFGRFGPSEYASRGFGDGVWLFGLPVTGGGAGLLYNVPMLKHTNSLPLVPTPGGVGMAPPLNHTNSQLPLASPGTLPPLASPPVNAHSSTLPIASDVSTSTVVPLSLELADEIAGSRGLVRSVVLNDRIHALSVGTRGQVAVWDAARGVCRGVFVLDKLNSEHDGQQNKISPCEALNLVLNRIEGEAMTPVWASINTRVGDLTVHLIELRCFDAEVYVDEIGWLDMGVMGAGDAVQPQFRSVSVRLRPQPQPSAFGGRRVFAHSERRASARSVVSVEPGQIFHPQVVLPPSVRFVSFFTRVFVAVSPYRPNILLFSHTLLPEYAIFNGS